MLMSPHNGAVDHGIFVVGIRGEMLKDLLPDAGAGPTGKARVNLDRIAEPLRQVAPGDASAIAVEHRLDKQTVVTCRHPDVAFTAGQ
jgi:hypothetical protein